MSRRDRVYFDERLIERRDSALTIACLLFVLAVGVIAVFHYVGAL